MPPVSSVEDDWMMVHTPQIIANHADIALNEEDYVQLLEQLPFDTLLDCMFYTTTTDYLQCLRMFGVCGYLLHICADALQIFAAYGQLVKLLGSIIATIVQRTTGYIEDIRSSAVQVLSMSQFKRLQYELDRFYIHVVEMFMSLRSNHALLQFMAHFRYESVGSAAAWQIFHTVYGHIGNAKTLNDVVMYSYEEWETVLKSNMNTRLLFASAVGSGVEGVFLLHTLSRLACAQQGTLPQIILSELFHIGCMQLNKLFTS